MKVLRVVDEDSSCTSPQLWPEAGYMKATPEQKRWGMLILRKLEPTSESVVFANSPIFNFSLFANTNVLASSSKRDFAQRVNSSYKYRNKAIHMRFSLKPDQNNLTFRSAITSTKPRECIDTVIALSRAGLLDRAMDVVFESFNDWQHNGDFQLCDYTILYLLQNVTKIEPTLLVSFLVITLAAKSKLFFRSNLYATAERIYRERFSDKRTRDLLMGLK